VEESGSGVEVLASDVVDQTRDEHMEEVEESGSCVEVLASDVVDQTRDERVEEVEEEVDTPRRTVEFYKGEGDGAEESDVEDAEEGEDINETSERPSNFNIFNDSLKTQFEKIYSDVRVGLPSMDHLQYGDDEEDDKDGEEIEIFFTRNRYDGEEGQKQLEEEEGVSAKHKREKETVRAAGGSSMPLSSEEVAKQDEGHVSLSEEDISARGSIRSSTREEGFAERKGHLEGDDEKMQSMSSDRERKRRMYIEEETDVDNVDEMLEDADLDALEAEFFKAVQKSPSEACTSLIPSLSNESDDSNCWDVHPGVKTNH
jgi:hypothetical protein